MKRALGDIRLFASAAGLRLRAYQTPAAQAIVQSVLQRQGLTFVVMFPRQSGKNELQAQIEAYLLALLCQGRAEIVKVAPTWRPQGQNALRRLERVLRRNPFTRGHWQREGASIVRLLQARVYFLSGAPGSNVVGATASALLACDEAQDVLPDKWDREFAPMAASANATRVFWGTAWTAQTLLARERRAAEWAERQDGIRRVFVLGAEEVGRQVPAYAAYVANEVRRLGRLHPFIRTQYFSEEIDGEGGLFPPARRAQMRGTHPPHAGPLAGRLYAFLLDVAGAAETPLEGGWGEPGAPGGAESAPAAGAGGRDATALTIVEVGLDSLSDPARQAPTYLVAARRLWEGTSHPRLYAELQGLVGEWGPRVLVVDATGVGAGLAGFLQAAFPAQTRPFVFSQASKSKLGWDFLALVETGRFLDHAPARPPRAGETPEACLLAQFDASGRPAWQTLFWRQVIACRHTAHPGPERSLRWGVPEGTRDPQSGKRVHDDLLVSAALCATLDHEHWGLAHSQVLGPPDPLAGMGETF